MRNRFFYGSWVVHNRISQFLLHHIPLLSCLSNSAIVHFHHNSQPCDWIITVDCKNFRVVIVWHLTALPHNSLQSPQSLPWLQNSHKYFHNYTICENLKNRSNLCFPPLLLLELKVDINLLSIPNSWYMFSSNRQNYIIYIVSNTCQLPEKR